MKIIKQKRKTLSLKIDTRGEVVIKVPLFFTKKQVEKFIEKHTDWIQKQQKKVAENSVDFSVGNNFLYFGDSFVLEFGTGRFRFDGDRFITSKDTSEEIKKQFIIFYKQEAKKYIVPKTYEIAEKLGLTFNNIRITSAKTRWGSCSSKKNLNFSWRLAMVPKDIIDYVIIHELAHLTEMNHSKNFWNLVEKYYSILGKNDYASDRRKLKTYSMKTNF